MDDLMDFKAYLIEAYPAHNWAHATLTPEAVRNVKYLLGKGDSVKSIALDMDISVDQVYKIRRGETYKEIK